jgi:hypothetical protein
MLDPTVVAAIISASGGLLGKLLELAGKSPPEDQAKKVVAKIYEKVASEITTHSLRVILVLKDAGTNQSPTQIAARVSPLAALQEPDGDTFESDLTYRLKFLSLLGLLQPVGGSEYAVTRLGVAFIDKARTDPARYQSAFKVCTPKLR